MIAPDAALKRLTEGNKRFVAGDNAGAAPAAPSGPVTAQTPFAIVLGCSDSRVPAEIVFDQGLGDLFVIRVAGNVVAPSQIGSVEFAAGQFGTRLVVVLGHSHCGAVGAALSQLKQPGATHSPNLSAIVNRILPALEPLVVGAADGNGAEQDKVFEDAVIANVRASVQQLLHGSDILESLVEEGTLAVMGAVYDLESGTVAFLPDA